MNNRSNFSNNSEATAEITISMVEYNKLLSTINQQQAEIDVLEFRIETLLGL